MDAARRFLHIQGNIFSGALRSLKNKPALPEQLFCVPTKTWKMLPMSEHASKRGGVPSPRVLRVYKGKVRLNSIRRKVTRASQEIHILHAELFHEKQGEACSCFYI